MKLNEMNEASLGGAIMSKLGQKLNPFSRSGESSMSIKDRMVKKQFVDDLVGRAATNLNQGIKSGTINPDTKAGLEPSVKPVEIGSNVKPAAPLKQEPIKIGGQTLDPKNPADKKIIDKIQAQQSAGQKAPVSAPAEPAAAPAAAPETPEQIRIRKQRAAAQAAQAQMKPKPTVAQAPAPKTPAQIRAEKQAAAAQAAQSQMTPKPPAAPAPKTPAQIRAEKQAAAAQAAQSQMTPAKPAVWKNPRRPNQPAKTSPQFEDKFNKLNAIFENIVNMDEATKNYPYTISSYLQEFLKQYLGGIDVSSLKPQIDKVQTSFKLGGGRKALENLASAAYSIYWTGGAGTSGNKTEKDAADSDIKDKNKFSVADLIGGPSTAPTTAPATTPATAPAAPQAASPAQPTPPAVAAKPSQPPTDSTPPPSPASPAASNAMEPAKASPEKVKSVYMQVKDLVNKLDKKGKQRILATLEKEIGVAPVVSKTTKTKPSKVTNIKKAKSLQTKQPASNVIPIKRNKTKKAVAESKTYKVWGQN